MASLIKNNKIMKIKLNIRLKYYIIKIIWYFSEHLHNILKLSLHITINHNLI